MSKIVVLESQVVDQIAAGEVVERPAHLVKELVENAIDAGATHIEVEYDLGGRRVRVTDDGKGIAKEDLSLALARHATSKIKEATDLWNLSTFGFRGEALASIAAVSRLTLRSRPKESSEAFEVHCEFGKIAPAQAVAGNLGTTISIDDLFENVPARLKFMKSEAGEHGQIKATMKAIALANENIEFKLKSKGKIEEFWPKASSFLERTKTILGVSDLYEATGGYGELKTQTVFASPHDVAGTTRSILVFVQGRWVQDRSLQAAVTEAYRGLLMHGEYPMAVVRLTSPPAEVDVNIHPTKSQIKFRDPQSAFRAVQRPLREALEKAPWSTKGMTAQGAGVDPQAVSFAPSVSPRLSAEPAKKMTIADLTRPYERAESVPVQPSFEKTPEHSIARFEAAEFSSVQFKQKFALDDAQAAPFEPQANTGQWSKLQVLGQAHLTYIVAQDVDRLVLIDQHAAHERVAYEKLMRAWMDGKVDRQNLLIPLNVELESADGPEAVLSVAQDLEKLGLEVDQSGPQSIAIRSIPVAMKESAIQKAIVKLAREVSERGGSFAMEHKISDLCATIACHSVVRAGQALSLDQMRKLLAQMDEFPLSSFCPHGRPVSVDYPFSRLERDFGRLV